MSDESKCCDRCGARLGRDAVHVEIVPSGGGGAGGPSTIDACKECGHSLTRWLERGRDRAEDGRKPRAPESRKPTHHRRRLRMGREQMAFIVVVILCILFCMYFLPKPSE